LLATLFLLSLAANASYLVHLKYENGVVTQEEVFDVNMSPDTGGPGAFQASLNGYSSNFSFPSLTMYDYASSDSFNASELPGEQIVRINTASDAFVVLPQAPSGSQLQVSNSSATLLNEPIQTPTPFEPPVATCSSDADCPSGSACLAGTCVPAQQPSTCCPAFILPALVALGLLAFERKRT
jgi:hypothetical protein